MLSENMVAVRQEILDLLRQQMEVLDSPLGVTEDKLRECYERQSRVQELREKLQTASNSEREIHSSPNMARAVSVSPDSAADQCVS
jgi:hypothetical protein